jgi:biotin carboxylase
MFAPSFVASDHAHNVVYDGDVERCARELARHRPIAVIPGTESGVALADALAVALGTPNNGLALTAARRDKLLMQQTIRAAGLYSIPSHAATEWPAIEAWLAQLGRYPVVLKPRASAGTDGVHICADLEEARAAFDAINGGSTILGTVNRGVLAQQFMTGSEHMVNTVSYGGHHLMTDAWIVNKVRGKHPVYDDALMLDPKSELVQQLYAYTCAALDALGVRFGPVHTELMLTPEGPVLIEANCRMDGQKCPEIVQGALGYSQVNVTCDAYLDPAAFFTRARAPVRELPRHASRVLLIARHSGSIASLPRERELSALTSYFHHELFVRPGDRLEPTIDLHTCPGYIDLIHEDPEVIRRDTLQIRAWEQSDFYQLS